MQGIWELSVPSSPFFCKSKTSKIKSLFLRIGASSWVLHFQNSPHKCSLFPNYSCLHQGYVNAHPNIGTTLPPWPQAPTQSTQNFQHPYYDGSHVFSVESSPQHGVQGLSTSLTPRLPLSVYCTFPKKLSSLQLPGLLLMPLYLLIPHLGCLFPTVHPGWLMPVLWDSANTLFPTESLLWPQDGYVGFGEHPNPTYTEIYPILLMTAYWGK